MKTIFNEYTMNNVALLGNGIQIIEQFGRFLVVKEYQGILKVFFNTADINSALNYGRAM